MKAVFLTREGNPLYSGYRIATTENEEQRIRQMITCALRCQRGSEIFPEYGLELDALTMSEHIAYVLINSALSNVKLFPGISDFNVKDITLEDNNTISAVIAYTTVSGTTNSEEMLLSELQ